MKIDTIKLQELLDEDFSHLLDFEFVISDTIDAEVFEEIEPRGHYTFGYGNNLITFKLFSEKQQKIVFVTENTVTGKYTLGCHG